MEGTVALTDDVLGQGGAMRRGQRSVGTNQREVEEMMMARGVIVSYGVARRALLPSVEHRRSKYLNNRAENSRISPHFRPRRNRLSADAYRREMTSRFATWNEVVGLPAAAS